MDLKEFYTAVGGDYDEVMSRLRKEERIVKYVGKFTKNEGFQKLTDAIAANDVKAIFETSHDVKGLCANLGFGTLQQLASDICEQCRNGAPDMNILPDIFAEAQTEYASIRENIKQAFPDVE